MKKLNEVIDELEDEGLFPDALHYLKEYKDKQNVGTMMLALHNTNKTVCDDCWLSREMAREGFKQIYKKYIEEENPPLTWNELKQMEGKPVWVEYGTDEDTALKRWCLVQIVLDEYISLATTAIFFRAEKSKQGKTWQAYRKERNENA